MGVTDKKSERRGIVLLLLTSLIWGFAFVFNSTAYRHIGVLTFNGIRCLLGSAVLSPFLIKDLKKIRDGSGRNYIRLLFKVGAACGILHAVSSSLQQSGLKISNAGNAGFLSTLYTFFVPFIYILSGKKLSTKNIITASAAVVGVILLCVGTDFSPGCILIIVSTVFAALQIIAIEVYGSSLNGAALMSVQFAVSGALNLIVGLCTETTDFSTINSCISQILYSGICSCGIAYTLQSYGIKYVKSTVASVILSAESVWAAVGGMLILNEKMSAMEAAGCLIIFSAVITAAVLPSGEKKT